VQFCDAHNHLQDERFGGRQEELVAACRQVGVVRMVVNGAGEQDWPAVAELAGRHPDLIQPSFGYHPWYIRERTADWREHLQRYLERIPGAAVGEIGLDRWKPGLPYDDQEAVFTAQWQLACERHRPVTIHCLRAWGRLFDLLRAEPPHPRGFLLHSYGGPLEMVPSLARLGAYFGFPGYFLHARKVRQRAAFRGVPPDRLLVETDAPDQLLPEAWNHYPLNHPAGAALNHPANLAAVYQGLAEFFAEDVHQLASRVDRNFRRLFGQDRTPAAIPDFPPPGAAGGG
jgi:TatD DNase family protein